MSGASVGRPWRKLSSKGHEAEQRAWIIVESEDVLGNDRKAEAGTRSSNKKSGRSDVIDLGSIFWAAVAAWCGLGL